MDFQLSPEQQGLQRRCKELATDFAARAAAHDREASHPVENYAAMLRSEGLLTDAMRRDMEASVAAEIAQAVAVADAGLWEPVEDLTRDVYTAAATA